ncbi:MAG: cryptochrome/photolyase family protein [Halobacteriota archaeon]
MEVHWHRRDLRVRDNAALDGATDVVPVYVLDPAVLRQSSEVRQAFLRRCLETLDEAYRDRGGALHVLHGESADVLPRFASRLDAGLTWNRGYSGLSRERDRGVRDALDSADVDYRVAVDRVFHEPGEIKTEAGDPYRVFRYYYEKWKRGERPSPRRAPVSTADTDVAKETGARSLDGIGSDVLARDVEVDLPPAGPEAARRRLQDFCDGDIHSYDVDRDYPARAGTSRLSPYLRFGCVGIREVWSATVEAERERESDGAEEFRRQLAWREFYVQLLYYNPRMPFESLAGFDGDPWRYDDVEAEVEAWRRGETGYPLVDAGMRQLLRTGWMHNRVRMVAASFLTKHLLVDWRVGYDWFREHLVDHDTANESGGWQWAASTGADAQPYFRVFNPTKQLREYDPEARYVRRHVEELSDVSTDVVLSWNEMDADERREEAPGYPDPVVEHGFARQRALEAFETARDGESD